MLCQRRSPPKKKSPQPVSSIRGDIAPIFQRLTIEAPAKEGTPPPPPAATLGGHGRPQRALKRKGAGGRQSRSPLLPPSEGVEGTRL